MDYLKHAFNPDLICDQISNEALSAAQNIRGENRKPAIIVHGVLPRSGTVYTGELIRLHPDIAGYPHEIWEFPFLLLAGHFLNAQQDFFRHYSENIGKIGDHDFLPLFGASLINYLYSFVPDDKILLLKVPNVRFLNLFFSVFPFENLLLLLRDGRDVVCSTIKTWPDQPFEKVCRQWDGNANIILNFAEKFRHKSSQFLVSKYEDSLDSPISYMTEICSHFGLDRQMYPYESIDDIKLQGSSTVRQGKDVSWDGLEKPENFKPVGKWAHWTEEEKRIFKEIAGESLIKAGYVKNNNW